MTTPPPGQYPQGPYPPPQGQGQYPPPQGQGQYPPPQGQYQPQGPYPPPGQYPPPQYPPPPGGFAPPPRKRGKRKFFIIGAIAVLVVVVAGAVVIGEAVSDDVTLADEGDCVTVTKASATDSDGKVTSCTDPEALYQVGKKLDQAGACPTEDYTSFELTQGDKTERVLCLVPNFRQGSCYKLDTTDKARYVNADCASTEAEVKVAKRIDGKNDESLCDEYFRGLAVAYPEPSRTLCLVAP